MAIFQILQFKILKAIFQAFFLINMWWDLKKKKHELLARYKNIMRKSFLKKIKWFLKSHFLKISKFYIRF